MICSNPLISSTLVGTRRTFTSKGLLQLLRLFLLLEIVFCSFVFADAGDELANEFDCVAVVAAYSEKPVPFPSLDSLPGAVLNKIDRHPNSKIIHEMAADTGSDWRTVVGFHQVGMEAIRKHLSGLKEKAEGLRDV